MKVYGARIMEFSGLEMDSMLLERFSTFDEGHYLFTFDEVFKEIFQLLSALSLIRVAIK